MAPPPGTLRVGRYFMVLLALLALLYLLVFWPGKRHTPKLGLDLVGGQQVTFQARAPHGKVPSSSAMSQALTIMRERVNGTGVTEAEVIQQGADEIVVSIPGGTKTDVAKLGAAAKLNFRGIVAPATPIACGQAATPTPSGSTSASPSGTGSGSASTSPSGSSSASASTSSSAGSGAKSGQAAHVRPLTAPTSTAKSTPTTSKTSPAASTPAVIPTSSPSASGSSGAASVPCALKSVAQLRQLVKSLPAPSGVYKSGGVSDTVAPTIAAALGRFDCSTAQTAPDPKNDYYLACDKTGTLAYLLGPVIVPGTEIDDAQAQASTTSTDWSIQLTLKSGGATAWTNYTTAHNINNQDISGASSTSCSSTATPCADFVGFTLDGRVISDPVNEEPIPGTKTTISGSFTQSSANDLAQQLKYGALPLTFQAQQAQSVSATLGTSQLKAGLLAGGIGLALVVVYSLVYYRALGLVTIASLLVSGALTYAMLVFLGRQIGFTLSLAGIAGFIVAVGITADSFVVFFERIKDEVHEGRSVRVAVPRAWIRARRTVLSADTVSFLAAAILYYFAAGDVKGFAFTLGMSTVLDLVVVFLFTHPIVSLLSRSRAFGSARFTGLSNVRAGGVVRGEDDPEARRAARAARVARTRSAGGSSTTTAATATVERDEVVDGVPAEADALDGSDDLEPGGPPSEPGADDDEAPRRRTTPAGGSAAERAAARRARLREQGKDEG